MKISCNPSGGHQGSEESKKKINSQGDVGEKSVSRMDAQCTYYVLNHKQLSLARWKQGGKNSVEKRVDKQAARGEQKGPRHEGEKRHPASLIRDWSREHGGASPRIRQNNSEIEPYKKREIPVSEAPACGNQLTNERPLAVRALGSKGLCTIIKSNKEYRRRIRSR